MKQRVRVLRVVPGQQSQIAWNWLEMQAPRLLNQKLGCAQPSVSSPAGGSNDTGLEDSTSKVLRNRLILSRGWAGRSAAPRPALGGGSSLMREEHLWLVRARWLHGREGEAPLSCGNAGQRRPVLPMVSTKRLGGNWAQLVLGRDGGPWTGSPRRRAPQPQSRRATAGRRGPLPAPGPP